MVGRKTETVTISATTNASTLSPKPLLPAAAPAAAATSSSTSATTTTATFPSGSRSTTPVAFESILGAGDFSPNKSDDVIYNNESPSSPNSTTSPRSIRAGNGSRKYFHGNDISHRNDGGDTNSLLGVIVDRSSFDEDDELTTFGGNMLGGGNISSSVIHEHPDELDMMIDNNLDALLQHQSGVGGGAGGSSLSGVGGGGIVMRNGKVRRKLRWKPRFGRRKSDGGYGSGETNFSSSASVVSALTNRSVSTYRSTSTSKSLLSHFSRKSQTSFHTFHSTETPVATNKANRPQAPHTVMRPNYQDSFDVAKSNNNDSLSQQHQQSTIDNEGHHSGLAKLRLGSNRDLSQVDIDRSSSLPDRLNSNNVVPISPRSPLSLSSPMSSFNNQASSGSPTRPHMNNNLAGVSSSGLANGSENNSVGATEEDDTSNTQKPSSLSSHPRSRRPPLFKGRLRNRQGTMNNSGSTANADDHNTNSNSGPTSPTDASQPSLSSAKGSLTAHTAPTASLSASISLDRENSILPVLSGDEYEESRRVSIHSNVMKESSSPSGAAATSSRRTPTRVVEEEKKDGGEDTGIDDLLMEEQGIEESSLSATAPGKSVSSASSVPNRSSSPSGNLFSRRRNTTGGAGLANSPSTTASANPQKRYNRPVDSSMVLSGMKTSPTSSSRLHDDARRTKSSKVPTDLDEGAFLEAEYNLRAVHEMATEHLAHGEYEEAIDVFEEILRGQQERYGQDHYRVGTALHNLGIVYLKKGDYEKASEICSRAVQVRKEALVPNHPDVAVSLAQLGVAYLESNQYRKALEAFQDALHIRRNFLGPRHPRCSKILNNIGCALYSMEEFVEANRAFSEALDIQRDTLRQLPSAEGTESNGTQSNSLLLSMASTLCNIGSIRLRWGEFDKAIVALDEALLVSGTDRKPAEKSV